MPKSESLKLLFAQSLFFKEQRERFALVHLYKRAIAIKSLPLPFTTERLWAFRSGRSWQKSNGSNSLFFTSESLFHLQKASNSLEKAMSEFPTLHLLEHVVGVPVVLLACSVDVPYTWVPRTPVAPSSRAYGRGPCCTWPPAHGQTPWTACTVVQFTVNHFEQSALDTTVTKSYLLNGLQK